MKIEFDPFKSQKNADERGLSFDKVVEFNWETARTNPDDRFFYPEPRFSSYGYIGDRLYFTMFHPNT